MSSALAEGANHFLRALLPEGGVAVQFVKAVIDESKPSKQTPLLCVGGYAFDANAALDFHLKWSVTLAAKNVKFFHRADLLGPRKTMAHLTQDEANALQEKLISFVRELTLFGFAVALNQRDFELALSGYALIRDDGSLGETPKAYPFACMICLIMVRRWIEKKASVGEVAYVFESGHEDELAAHRFISDEIRDRPRARRRHRYGGHAFRPKDKDPGLQAADLMAWHTAKMYVQRAGGFDQRADFIQLFGDRDQDRLLHYKTPQLIELRDLLVESGHIRKI